MFKQQKTWWLVAGTLLLLLLALNFLNFHLSRSATEVSHSLATSRAGEALPDSMAPGFTLFYTVTGSESLAAALTTALETELEAQPSVGAVAAAQDAPIDQPYLVIDVSPERLWTPVYARATVTAQLFYAHDGDAPWPAGDPVVFEASPAVKASGVFTLTDSSYGLISRPAYTQHLARALAEAVAAALQNDVFTIP